VLDDVAQELDALGVRHAARKIVGRRRARLSCANDGAVENGSSAPQHALGHAPDHGAALRFPTLFAGAESARSCQTKTSSDPDSRSQPWLCGPGVTSSVVSSLRSVSARARASLAGR
jgi:hypothetical protein